MPEFKIQSDAVDVTRIMKQIRQRIQEKRGRDYTEEQIRELATVKLERFLDPQQVRSDLVEHYRQLEPPAALAPPRQDRPSPPETFDFDEHTIYASSRGTMGKLIRLIRKLLSPFLKLFFNLNSIVFALSRQSEINTWTLQLLQQQADLAERVTQRAGAKFAAREELDALNYEVLNNLVVEMTRLSVDMKNHRSLVESVAGRLDFDERRARALESVVQNRSPQPAQSDDGESAPSTGTGRTRRRRRRSRRRPGTATTPDGPGTPTDAATKTGAQGETGQPASSTATPPAASAASDPVPPPRQDTAPPPAPTADPSASSPAPAPPPPAAAPSRDPAPPTPPAVTAIDDHTPAPPSTPTPSEGSAPAPTITPAAESVAAPSPTSKSSTPSTTGHAGTDQQ